MRDTRGSTVRATAAPLWLHGSFESTDLDEIHAVAGEAQCPIRAEPVGRRRPLRFHLHHHPLTALALTHARLDHVGRLDVTAPPLTDHYYVQLPLRGAAGVTCGEARFAAEAGRHGLVLSPSLACRQRQEGGFEEITLEVDAEAVALAWRSLTGRVPASPIVFDPMLRLDREPGASILRLARFLVGEIAHPGSALSSTVARAHLEKALLSCLLEGQRHSASDELRCRRSPTRAALVREAEAWLEAHAAQPVGPCDLADALGTSLRTLQRSFEQHRGYTPRAFLRRIRLERAHAHLRRGGPDASVTRTALELGFTHLGRFSGEYRARYGVSPSTTLRAARRGKTPSGNGPAGSWVHAAPEGGETGEERERGACGFCAGAILPA